MKKKLNNLAIWLYKKTRKSEDFLFNYQALIVGKKVIQSQYLPEDTIMIGHKDYRTMAQFFMDSQIVEEKERNPY